MQKKFYLNKYTSQKKLYNNTETCNTNTDNTDDKWNLLVQLISIRRCKINNDAETCNTNTNNTNDEWKATKN